MVLAGCLFYAFFLKKNFFQIIDKWEREEGREDGREEIRRERGTRGEQPSLTKCSKAAT